jgi:tRNA pseudouridine(38-40) synthase
VSAFGQVVALHLRSNLLHGEGIVSVPAALVEEPQGTAMDDVPQTTQPASEATTTTTSTLHTQQNSKPSTTARTEFKYISKLNAILPAGIVAHGWAPVPQSFNARFGCATRTYKYFFLRGTLDINVCRYVHPTGSLLIDGQPLLVPMLFLYCSGNADRSPTACRRA